jgi:hypothetical protein
MERISICRQRRELTPHRCEDCTRRRSAQAPTRASSKRARDDRSKIARAVGGMARTERTAFEPVAGRNVSAGQIVQSHEFAIVITQRSQFVKIDLREHSSCLTSGDVDARLRVPLRPRRVRDGMPGGCPLSTAREQPAKARGGAHCADRRAADDQQDAQENRRGPNTAQHREEVIEQHQAPTRRRFNFDWPASMFWPSGQFVKSTAVDLLPDASHFPWRRAGTSRGAGLGPTRPRRRWTNERARRANEPMERGSDERTWSVAFIELFGAALRSVLTVREHCSWRAERASARNSTRIDRPFADEVTV